MTGTKGESRRHRRHKQVIRNRIIFGFAVIIIVALIILGVVKLVTSIDTDDYVMATTSTLHLNSDDTVTYEEISDFDEEEYSVDELKDFVDEEISDYGKGVKLKSLKVDENVATLKMEYSSASDFKDFSGYDFYMGTVSGALAEGYEIDESLYEVSKGEDSEALNIYDIDGPAKIIILSEKVAVKVKGKITYASDNVTVSEKDTASPVENALGDIVIIYK